MVFDLNRQIKVFRIKKRNVFIFDLEYILGKNEVKI